MNEDGVPSSQCRSPSSPLHTPFHHSIIPARWCSMWYDQWILWSCSQYHTSLAVEGPFVHWDVWDPALVVKLRIPSANGAGGGLWDKKANPYLEYLLILLKMNCCPFQCREDPVLSTSCQNCSPWNMVHRENLVLVSIGGSLDVWQWQSPSVKESSCFGSHAEPQFFPSAISFINLLCKNWGCHW